MEKLLTKKQVTDEVTAFIKAYRKRDEYECMWLIDDLQIGDEYFFVEVIRTPTRFKDKMCQVTGEWSEIKVEEGKFKLEMSIFKGEDDENPENHNPSINIEGNTTTEIADFLAFEYHRRILKRVK